MVTPKKPKVDYSLYFLTVNDFSASLYAGLNHEAVQAANKYETAIPVFKNHPSLTFDCHCFYPESHDGLPFHITVHTNDRADQLTLSDCVVLDDNNHLKRIKRRGQLFPVHNVPNGIGYMEKVRGVNEWRVICFISSQAISTMISILSLGKQCYLMVDEMKIQRNRAVRALELQTDKPE